MGEPVIFFLPHKTYTVELSNLTPCFCDDLTNHLGNDLSFTSGFHVTLSHLRQELSRSCYLHFVLYMKKWRLKGLQLSDLLKATVLVSQRTRIQP